MYETIRKRNKHITYSERLKIEALYKAKKSVKEISLHLGIGLSTVYRELKRGLYSRLNSDYSFVMLYSADIAQRDYEYKATAKGAHLKIGNDFELVHYIEDKILKHHYSPAAVLGEIKNKGLQFKTSISKTTLYRYIDEGLFLSVSNHDLIEGKRKKQQYKKVRTVSSLRPLHSSIDSRSDIISCRAEFGHWEMDTVVGKRTGINPCLLVLSERKTREEIIIKIRAKTTQNVVKALDALERKYGKHFSQVFKTITVDNGSEFMDRPALEKHNRTKIFYCHPYSSWERGTNENINRMIRRFIKKGSAIQKYTHAQIKEIETWLNNYPRAIHNYQSSNTLFCAELQKIGII